MSKEDYHKKIVDYYKATENAYKDSWDLDKSLSIHYGYWDDHVRSFAQSLQRMNEVMAEAAQIKPNVSNCSSRLCSLAIWCSAALTNT